MPAPSGMVPAYCHYKASGRAVVRLDGRDHYLGPYGSPESHERYARLIAEWQSRPRASFVAPVNDPRIGSLTINEVMLAYVEFAAGYYTKDGKPNQEFESIRYALRPLKELYGHKQAANFGPRDLKTLRQQLIDQKKSRTYINNNMNRIKRMFKWAVSEELVPPSVHQALQTVPGLRYGRSGARETQAVKPVPDAYVDAVLPFVAPPVAAMIKLQRLTGMRSGEVVIMRACDIDMTGKVWLYVPSDHKGKWRGKKEIPLGPRAQDVIRPFLTLQSSAYLFSPQAATSWHVQRRADKSSRSRISAVFPSEVRRRNLLRQQHSNRSRKKQPRERYDTSSYRHAIGYGIVLARCEGVEIPNWHPHQLRHTKATELRRTFRLEAAQVTLGHARADITEIYAERNLQQAIDLAMKTG
jgi:integrase